MECPMAIGNRGSGRSPSPHVAHGFAYLFVLLALVLVGLAASATVSLGAAASRREAERHLLSIGTEFELALESYADATPANQLREPLSLDELLRDSRTPGLRRHLRAIRPDPLTGSSEWGLRRGHAGEILGIHSLAPHEPIQRQGFGEGRGHFEYARRYSDWVFAVRLGRHRRTD